MLEADDAGIVSWLRLVDARHSLDYGKAVFNAKIGKFVDRTKNTRTPFWGIIILYRHAQTHIHTRAHTQSTASMAGNDQDYDAERPPLPQQDYR